MNVSNDIATKGYSIIEAEKIDVLLDVKKIIFEKCKTIFNYNGLDSDYFFNNLHKLNLSQNELNTKRIEIINYCSEKKNVNTLIYQAYEKSITALIGNDVLVLSLKVALSYIFDWQ